MSSSKQAVLVDAKNEYTRQLINMMTPVMYKGIKAIYEKGIGEPKKCLKNFQKNLSKIPKWNAQTRSKHSLQIQQANKCDWFVKLIQAVFVTHARILSAIRDDESVRTVDVDIPDDVSFVHRCYIDVARKFWKRPDLFYHKFRNVDIQRNMYECEKIIKDTIEDTIRSLLPVKTILMEYLDEKDIMKAVVDVDDDISQPVSISQKENLKKLVEKELETHSNALKNHAADNSSFTLNSKAGQKFPHTDGSVVVEDITSSQIHGTTRSNEKNTEAPQLILETSTVMDTISKVEEQPSTKTNTKQEPVEEVEELTSIYFDNRSTYEEPEAVNEHKDKAVDKLSSEPVEEVASNQESAPKENEPEVEETPNQESASPVKNTVEQDPATPKKNDPEVEEASNQESASPVKNIVEQDPSTPKENEPEVEKASNPDNDTSAQVVSDKPVPEEITSIYIGCDSDSKMVEVSSIHINLNAPVQAEANSKPKSDLNPQQVQPSEKTKVEEVTSIYMPTDTSVGLVDVKPVDNKLVSTELKEVSKSASLDPNEIIEELTSIHIGDAESEALSHGASQHHPIELIVEEKGNIEEEADIMVENDSCFFPDASVLDI